jgi:radical SAM superfamily enzyme YgiQ (UPF0313 family)
MKIVLADPPALASSFEAGYPNLGLLYLAGFLREKVKEHSLQIDYLGPNHTLKSHLDHIKTVQPGVYGLSFTSKAASLAYETMRSVKDVLPQTLVVCGGAHPTAAPAEVLDLSPCDVCVVGEGELTFQDIVNSVCDSDGQTFRDIDGIVYRQNGTLMRNKPRAFIKCLDDIPYPAWDLIDFKDFEGTRLKKHALESSLVTSRGCPYDCAFCSNPVWKSSKPWLRYRSVQNICGEIEVLYEQGVREILLSSDELNFNEGWALELCQAIVDLNHRDLHFQCNMRADKVSDELAQLLSRMGCWLVHLGVESGNDRVLKGLGKGVTVEQIERAARTLAKRGIRVFAFMMLFNVWEENGELCWETSQEVDNSIALVRRLLKERAIHFMSWVPATPMPGSRLYDIAKRHGLFNGDPEDVMARFDEDRLPMRIPGISERSLKWKIKKGIILKDWLMLRSGDIGLRHAWKAWENLKALAR